MQVVRDSEAEKFLSEAKSLLYADEATNSLLLGLAEMVRNKGESGQTEAVLLRVVHEGQTLTAALQTPPMNLVISESENRPLKVLAQYLKSNQLKFPGVVGPANSSEMFAKMWSRECGCHFELGMGQMIYKINEVEIPQQAVEGSLRLAQLNEISLIASWLVEFGNESLPPNERKSFEERLPYAERAIQNQNAYLWEVGGVAVSMAHVGRPTKNGISISAVYTPPINRKKGYASALVAHLSQRMLDSGKQFCVLYTDLANPTSNKIYQKIGYRAIAESKLFIFQGGHL